MPAVPAGVSVTCMRTHYRTSAARRRAFRAVAGAAALLAVFAVFAAAGVAMALAVAALR